MGHRSVLADKPNIGVLDRARSGAAAAVAQQVSTPPPFAVSPSPSLPHPHDQLFVFIKLCCSAGKFSTQLELGPCGAVLHYTGHEFCELEDELVLQVLEVILKDAEKYDTPRPQQMPQQKDEET